MSYNTNMKYVLGSKFLNDIISSSVIHIEESIQIINYN